MLRRKAKRAFSLRLRGRHRPRGIPRKSVELRASPISTRTLARQQGEIVENLPVLFYRSNAKHPTGSCLTFCARTFRVLTGYDPAQLSPWDIHPLLNIIVAEDRVWLKEEVQSAVRQERSFDVLYRIEHHDGGIRHILDKGEIAFDHSTQSPFVSGVIFDISRQIAATEDICRDLSSSLLTAQEDERERIARELHDGIGQSLTSVVIRLGHSVQLLQGSDPATQGPFSNLKEEIESATAMVRDSIEEVRRICSGLRPAVLDDLGIVAALAWLTRRFQEVNPNISCRAEVDIEESDVPEGLKIEIFRIVQEAFNNVAKHAQAKHLGLVVTSSDEEIIAIVKDDGRGFDVDLKPYDKKGCMGSGLPSLRRRVALAGGHVSICTKEGTVLRVVWPRAPLPAKGQSFSSIVRRPSKPLRSADSICS